MDECPQKENRPVACLDCSERTSITGNTHDTVIECSCGKAEYNLSIQEIMEMHKNIAP